MFPFMPLRERLALIADHGVDARFLPRALLGLVLSAASLPLRYYEKARHGSRLRRTEVHPQPLFILGCARSGTTHLHNLLALDPRFGHVTNFQVMAQPFALSGATWLKPLLGRLAPVRRPMDNVLLELDGAQEEDAAVAAVSRHSAMHALSFPRCFDRLFRRYMLMELEPGELRAWEKVYLGVLRKATIACGGKPLVLKSPTNTARLPTLRRLFPEATFVHIHRDPYDVFRSLRHSYRKVLPTEQLQQVSDDVVEDDFVAAYQSLMGRLLEDRQSLPPNRFVEMGFADLEAQPLEALEKIYSQLRLGDFAAVRPRFEAYLNSLGSYERNVFEHSDDVIERVNRDWDSVRQELGYPRCEPTNKGRPATGGSA